MLRTALLLLITFPLLAACAGKDDPADAAAGAPAASAVPAQSQPAAAAPTTQAPAAEPASGLLGHYSAGDTRVEFREAVWLPQSEPGVLSVLLVPTALSAGERAAVLASTTFPGGPLMVKRDGPYADRYPFVVIKLWLEGEGDAATVRRYYLLASAIHEPNYTDNLNGSPDARHRLQLERVDGMRRLSFSGEDEMGGMLRRWAFDVPADAPPAGG